MPAPPLLAFVHIEKAAGTSLIHILRRNYFPWYVDVRPLRPESSGEFRPQDLLTYKKLNPWLRCIGGHSVKPGTGLEEVEPGIKYITVLRDPVKRYMSQYIYWRDRMGKSISFEDYLELPKPRNFQVKKIAGVEDAGRAVEILRERFLLVGLVEQFQEFLQLLAYKLAPMTFDCDYKEQNVAKSSSESVSLLQKYNADIEANNAIDMELYESVKRELVPEYLSEFSSEFKGVITNCLDKSVEHRSAAVLGYADYVLRKLYLEVLTGGIRRIRGMPASGSY